MTSLTDITVMLAGLVRRGNASLTIHVDQDELIQARRLVADFLGSDVQVIESDDRDTYVWQLDATSRRGWIVVYVVWMREGRQRPPGDVVDLAAARLLRDLMASLEPCPCGKTQMQHTPAQRAVCDARHNTPIGA